MHHIEAVAIDRVTIATAIDAALARCPHPLARLMLLMWLMGYSYRDIGALVGVSGAQVGRVVKRVREGK